MFNYKGMELLFSEMKLVLCTPEKTANVPIALFMVECSAGTRLRTEIQGEKVWRCFPTNMGMSKRAQLEAFRTRENLGRGSA